MKNKQTILFILLIIFSVFFFACEGVATLFHGEKPEPEKAPQITVLQGGDSISNSGDFNFYKTEINTPKSFSFTIKNSGDADLIFNSVEGNKIKLLNNDTDFFTLLLPSLLDTVAPGESINFEIKFKPEEKGDNYNALVQITTNCIINPVFSFTVSGGGAVKYTTDPPIIFNSSNDGWSLANNISNITYPATVEVYALGAGGGGQGGHSFVPRWNESDFMGTGAQGGGGAAAYIKFSVDASVVFNVTVGIGGGGGIGKYNQADMFSNAWLPGDAGGNGGSTSVNVVGVTTVTAGGGYRGYGGGNGVESSGGAMNNAIKKGVFAESGGNGGTATGTNISESQYVNGSRGIDGTVSGTTTPINNTASIIRGSLGSFGGDESTAGRGGRGGYSSSQSGSRGGDGLVVIVVSWYD